ncbi:MAG TPA: hypothetical protein VL172_06665, partial [Kofleriaceae bacterium]|nr:hypothetical protein [Kofleriaceae bacterium]
LVYHPAAVEAAAQALPWVARAALIESRGDTLLVVEPRLPRSPAAVLSMARAGGLAPARALRRHLADAGMPIDRVAFARRLPVDPRHRAKLDYAAVRRQFS